MGTVNPCGRRRVGWRRVLASLVAVALSGVVTSGCTVAPMPKCGGRVVVLFPELDLTAEPSANAWVNGFRYCKEAVPLDYAEYTRERRGAGCALERSGVLVLPLIPDDPQTITIRLNLNGEPGPTRTFEVELGEVLPDTNGCRVQYVSFQDI